MDPDLKTPEIPTFRSRLMSFSRLLTVAPERGGAMVDFGSWVWFVELSRPTVNSFKRKDLLLPGDLLEEDTTSAYLLLRRSKTMNRQPAHVQHLKIESAAAVRLLVKIFGDADKEEMLYPGSPVFSAKGGIICSWSCRCHLNLTWPLVDFEEVDVLHYIDVAVASPTFCGAWGFKVCQPWSLIFRK